LVKYIIRFKITGANGTQKKTYILNVKCKFFDEEVDGIYSRNSE
jgi:hypothetical protein